ncbi:matrix metalloproteinase-18-like [Bufo bufo]|uniref:matrix metalloproteinase-18-like n=1 Tax=Bufo bufo TaxID=8384 RepID=UPI001ABDDFF4|nr:matrix metalloproteinase-18-like [Bufo bufo]
MTTRELRIRIQEHQKDIRAAAKIGDEDRDKLLKLKQIARHFRQKHNNCWQEFRGIDKISLGARGGNLFRRLEQIESKWIVKLNTQVPHGLNDKIPFASFLPGSGEQWVLGQLLEQQWWRIGNEKVFLREKHFIDHILQGTSLRPRDLSSSTRMSLITSALICFAASILAFPAKQKEGLELAKNVKTSEASAATGRIIRPVPDPKPFVYLKKKIEMDPDITLNQTKRDAVQESQIRVWKNTSLTYRIVNFTPDLPKADVVSAIKRAFKIWSDVTPLTFKRVPKGISDIEIEFVTGDHKDNSPFNDTDEQLAHAFGPGPDIGGNIHINDANNFTTTNQRYNLFLMVAHEIGHSLGLSHSGTYGDLMYGEYQNTDASDFLLPQNDINAIQLLYGPSPDRTVQLTGPTTPSICDNSTVIDAVTTLRQDLFYFTQRFVLRKVSEMEQVELEFIQTFWPFLPNNVDAAYENPYMDSVIVFKGTKFWSFSELNVQKEGSIYEFGFPKSVKSIHAAAYVQDKDKTYFFVNDKYWRFDEDTQVMDKGFPRNIEDDFPGIQPRINGAVFYKGGLHLFKDHLQYEFCLDTRRIKQVASITSWMGCK